jgi:hypothetical protein
MEGRTMTELELLEEKLTVTTKHIVGLLKEVERRSLYEATKTICAWCGRIISKGDLVDGHVSHGICALCAKKATSQDND